MRTISTEQAIKLIHETKGKIFSAVYVKKDGTDRMINARLGVYKGRVKGKGLAFNPTDHDLLNVFDMHKLDYRMIQIGTLKTIQVNGDIFSIKD